MSSARTDPAPRSVGRDLRMVWQQLGYEQLAFWRNPIGAVFTVGFSVVFLVLLASAAGHSRNAAIGNLEVIQYYVPGFAAYGVMSACFNLLAISLVVRRETGLLKRLRLSPLPTAAMVAAVFLNVLVLSLVQVVLLVAIGRLGYGVHLPNDLGPLAVTLVVGAASFAALGIGVSTFIPNQEAAGPVISIVFFVLLFLSGLWYPLAKGSALARISAWFPMRHMITATFAPFDLRPGVSPWAWHDLGVMAIWGAAGAIVAVRRFRWAPARG
ncbi:MAG: ABC transporter permease [Acidimicrobiales bacterium]